MTAGSKVTLTLKYAAKPGSAPLYATVFNLASDGTVQVLYPLTAEDGDGRLGPNGDLPLLENAVVPPYGTDHVIALVVPQKPTAFRNLLRSIDNQRSGAQVVAPIKQLLAAANGGGSLSIGEVYTGE